jgi:hypothetical protein
MNVRKSEHFHKSNDLKEAHLLWDGVLTPSYEKNISYFNSV